MQYIAHRINTIEELEKLPLQYGVELDVRDYGEDLILSHDPFSNGEKFEEYLKHYKHRTMIVNVKSERIEHRIIELLEKYNIKDYFFLDSSIPMIYLLSNNGNNNFAVRFSEIEPIELTLALKNRVKWVWVDCFSKLPINKDNYRILKASGLKLCLVSPELQGRNSDIEAYKEYLSKENIIFDAICTKAYNINIWEEKTYGS